MVLEFMQRGQLAAGDPSAFPVLFISSVMQVTPVLTAASALVKPLPRTVSTRTADASPAAYSNTDLCAWLTVRLAGKYEGRAGALHCVHWQCGQSLYGVALGLSIT